MPTPRERAEAHYRTASQYMRYGDARKYRAHMSRALHYGFGANEDVSKMHADIDAVGIVGERGTKNLAWLLSKTQGCVRRTVVKQDDSNDEGKREAIHENGMLGMAYHSLPTYTTEVTNSFKKGIPYPPAVSSDSAAFFKDPRRLYGIHEGRLVNEAIGPNLADPNHYFSKASTGKDSPRPTRMEFTASEYATKVVHERIMKHAKEEPFIIAAVTSCFDKANATYQARDSITNEDEREVAVALFHFWESARDLVASKWRDVKVVPLMHARPSNKGYAVFQLLVNFSIELTYELVAKAAKRYEEANSDAEARSKAWKNMLRLMLNAATKLEQIGPFYKLEWN
jgi:hypothetical protein